MLTFSLRHYLVCLLNYVPLGSHCGPLSVGDVRFYYPRGSIWSKCRQNQTRTSTHIALLYSHILILALNTHLMVQWIYTWIKTSRHSKKNIKICAFMSFEMYLVSKIEPNVFNLLFKASTLNPKKKCFFCIIFDTLEAKSLQKYAMWCIGCYLHGHKLRRNFDGIISL